MDINNLGNESFFNEEEVSLQSLAKSEDGMTFEERQEIELLSSPDEIEMLSLETIQNQKKNLANLKSQVMMAVDKGKLQQAKKILFGMQNVQDIMCDTDIIERVRENTNTPQDIKLLAESYERMTNTLYKLMRIDSLDGSGTARKISLAVQFQDSNGSKTQAIIQTGE